MNFTKIPSIFNELSYDIGELDLAHNQITEYPILKKYPTSMDLGDNQIRKIPDLPSQFWKYSFRKNHIRELPENILGYELDMGYNQISSLPENGDWMGIGVLKLDHNPLTDISSLDTLLLNFRESLEQLDLRSCQLTHLPAIIGHSLKKIYIFILRLEDNPWREDVMEVLLHLDLLDKRKYEIIPDRKKDFRTQSKMKNTFAEYLLTQGKFVADLLEMIESNEPITLLERIHPDLVKHAALISAVCMQYPTETGKKIHNIIQKTMVKLQTNAVLL